MPLLPSANHYTNYANDYVPRTGSTFDTQPVAQPQQQQQPQTITTRTISPAYVDWLEKSIESNQAQIDELKRVIVSNGHGFTDNLNTLLKQVKNNLNAVKQNSHDLDHYEEMFFNLIEYYIEPNFRNHGARLKYIEQQNSNVMQMLANTKLLGEANVEKIKALMDNIDQHGDQVDQLLHANADDEAEVIELKNLLLQQSDGLRQLNDEVDEHDSRLNDFSLTLYETRQDLENQLSTDRDLAASKLAAITNEMTSYKDKFSTIESNYRKFWKIMGTAWP